MTASYPGVMGLGPSATPGTLEGPGQGFREELVRALAARLSSRAVSRIRPEYATDRGLMSDFDRAMVAARQVLGGEFGVDSAATPYTITDPEIEQAKRQVLGRFRGIRPQGFGGPGF